MVQTDRSRRLRILLLEDDPSWQDQVSAGLADQGIDVFPVATLVQAFDALERMSPDAVVPDAVVMDAILPEGDGLGGCRRLHERIGNRPIPILVLSGSDDERAIERAFESGASDYFVKSTQWKLLAERLVQLVDSAQMRDELASSQRLLDRAKGLAAIAQRSALQARELAHRDPLTGLLNRKGFIAATRAVLEARAAISQPPPCALVLVNLDRFKRLNDSLGAAAGDDALREVGRRLQQAFRNLRRISIGRLASDEFALLLPALRSAAAAERAADIVLAELRRPMVCGGLECVVRASVGIAVEEARDSEGAEALLGRADQALSSAKHAGGSMVKVFEPALGHGWRERFALETSLHQALDRNELVLHYQPIVEPRSGRVGGVEALMRWRRGERLVPPGDFIPIAEETGLIYRMGEWAIGEALQQVCRWRDLGIHVPTVAVNVPARHLEQPGLAQAVSGSLQSTGLDSSALELELTETGVMRDIKRSLESLTGLKRIGVKLALDDFGTGYSSLAYLTQLPIDTLKIDRAFVDKLGESGQSRAVVRSITALAQALGLSTVAEGVETREQLESLRALGCDEVQGFYFARPMAPRDLAGWWQRFGGTGSPPEAHPGGGAHGIGSSGAIYV